MHVHSPQRVLELPRTRTESGHASQQLHYERRAASAAILAAAALAIAVAVAAVLLLYAYKAIIRCFNFVGEYFTGDESFDLQDRVWEYFVGKTDEAHEDIDTNEGAQRSFFLTLQVLLFAYLCGQYLFAGPVLHGSLLCRFVGPWVLAPVYKPAVPTFWYLTMRVMETGAMHNNILTLTLNELFVGAVVVWLLIALVFTLPLTFVCYFYLGLAIMSPALFHRFAWPVLKKKEKSFRFEYTIEEFKALEGDDERTEINAATMVLTRLFLGGLVVSITIGASLLPFYQGASYVHVLSQIVASAMEGLKIWTPDFALTFAWPATLRFPERFGLAAALTIMGSEYALMAFQTVYSSMFPGGFGLVQERTDTEKPPDVEECNSF